MYYTSMNETTLDFLKSLNIDPQKINSLEGAKIKKDSDVNPILSRFQIYKAKKENKKVSIDNVVGYNYRCMDLNTNLFDNFSRFFDRDGDSYHKRSLSMLDIPKDEVMQQLEYSFKKEPVCLIEVDKGVYNIGNNGMHRFHIIKTHYLNELSKIDKNDKVAINKLKEKYSFDANISEIDYLKSYSAYMLRLLDDNLALENHFDENYELTDKSSIINYLNPKEKTVLTDEQLIDFVNKKMNQFLRTSSRRDIKQLKENVKKAFEFESFKNYYNETLMQNQKEEQQWS